MARPAPPIDEERVALSVLLTTAIEAGRDVTTIGDLVDHFGPRAFGASLLVFAMPNLLPLPPGSSSVLGLPLLLIAPQLAFGADHPWIPAGLARRPVDRKAVGDLLRRAAPWVARIEQVTTRRFGFMFGPVGDRLIGTVCTLLACVLFLPIPLGNLLPALAIAVLAMGLTQRDGLLTLLGYLFAAASAAVLVAGGHLVAAGVVWFGSATGLW